MDERIRTQIMAIRDSGVTNMLDIAGVQRAAFERGFLELVLFIEENLGDYAWFILHGDKDKS